MEFSKGYAGFANGLPPNDERLPEYIAQIEERGFDDTETWSLDTAIARLLYPRIKRYVEIAAINLEYHAGYKEALDVMIDGFRLASSEEEFDDTDEGQIAKVQAAYDALAKWHPYMWW